MYGRAITTGGPTTDKVLLKDAGVEIGASTKWWEGNWWGVLRSNSFKTNEGKIGYMGFRLQAGTDFYYGWMKFEVQQHSLRLLGYQYNNKPNESIITGSNCDPNTVEEKFVIDNNILLVPNPSSNFVKIENLTYDYIDGKIEVYSYAGSIVFSSTIRDISQKINTNDFSNGIYIVSIKNKNNTKFSNLKLNIIH